MRRKNSPADIAFNIVNYSLIGIFTLLCLYPIWYVLIYSLSDPLMASNSAMFWPVKPTFDNFLRIFSLPYLGHSFLISLGRTVIGTVLSVTCTGFFAYLLTQKNLPLRRGIYRYMVITMYFNAGLIPSYLVMILLGFRNNPLVYVIPGALSVFNVILVKTFLEQTSPFMEESAKIDGAGYFTIFFKIIVPISMPILATIAVFNAVGQWNSWFDNMLYIQNKNWYCAQYILWEYNQAADSIAQTLRQQGGNLQGVGKLAGQITPMSVRMTLTVIIVTPILFVYPFMQRYFVKGIMIGAIKG